MKNLYFLISEMVLYGTLLIWVLPAIEELAIAIESV